MKIHVYTIDEGRFENIIKDKNNIIAIKGTETNMIHPSLLFEYAKNIIKNAKKNDLCVYINTYNDILVEAIEVLSVKYYVEEFVKFFMNTPENPTIKEVYFDNISELYGPLGAYEMINKTRIKNKWRE